MNFSILIELLFTKFSDWVRGKRFVFLFKMWPTLFVGRGVRFSGISKIEFGNWVKIGSFCKVSSLGENGVRIGNNSGIGDYSSIVVSTSYNDIGKGILIGNNVGIGEYAYLGGAGGLTIDDDCIIGQYFSCHPENHKYKLRVLPIRLQGTTREGIHIKKNCWIGSKVTVLDGVVIGEGCVVAAGSVVTKSVPPFSVIGGVPAKILKSNY